MPEPMDEVQLVKALLDIPLFEDLDYTQYCKHYPGRGATHCEAR
jgi:hypothetical protein